MKAPLPAETLTAFRGDELGARIFYDKYALRDEANNRQVEMVPTQMWDRIAREISGVEPDAERRETWYRNFLWLLTDFRMVPGGRIMTGAGNKRNVTLANCYVMPSPKDTIDGPGSIFRTCEEMAAVYKRGGGCGLDISTLRPNGTPTRNAAITSSGAVSFINQFSTTTGTIGQRGRRGALMITLADNHPDVLAFTRVKRDNTSIKFANISIRISDAFMRAVETNGDWLLEYRNPEDGYEVKETIKARQLWDEIITGATYHAEPGVLFWDTVQRGSTSEYAGMEVISTNPCSEIPQGINANCTLSNVNLAAFVTSPFTPRAAVNMGELLQAVAYTTRFLDDVLDYNADRHALPAQKENSMATRRIGVGFTGLADMFIQLGIRYGSDQAVELTSNLFREVKEVAYGTSVLLAEEKGAFPLFDREKHLQSAFFQGFPEPLLDGIREKGLRNVAILTVPPVGSGAALCGGSSGIEPVFQLEYVRRSESLSQGEFTVQHSLLKKFREITETPVDQPLPPAFVTAHELTPEERIRIQAAIQAHIDQGISSTVNVPRETTPDTVAAIYRTAWEAGCKGVTVYREGSRDGILLSKDEAARRSQSAGKLVMQVNRLVDEKVLPASARLSETPKEQELAQFEQAVDSLLKEGPRQLVLVAEEAGPALKNRLDVAHGLTFKQEAPEAHLSFTVNEDDGNAYEVLCHGGKAGSDINALVQGLARMCSMFLRLHSKVPIRERIEIIIDQLGGIAGSKPIGFGPNRIGSIPDAFAHALRRYLAVKEEPAAQANGKQVALGLTNEALSAAAAKAKPTNGNGNGSGIFCGNCGNSMVVDEGCSKCVTCGAKEC